MLLRSFWHSPSPTSDLMRAAVLLKYWGYVLDSHGLVIDGNNRHSYLLASPSWMSKGASWEQARDARREGPARPGSNRLQFFQEHTYLEEGIVHCVHRNKVSTSRFHDAGFSQKSENPRPSGRGSSLAPLQSGTNYRQLVPGLESRRPGRIN
jgi:hypothetical protein